ncbi:hypothetical protein QO002_003981 [Pararhizobium capsulatum DSM 1112]|uniref:Uncharacterized protein n=1 Tax=Pararhizobium capsulatum DSM 1112 TaxID=1121113 RepID=A0ABU0BUB4_9HYPH|nr:hypothetical protein [Pararhizobium capsulatum DSM 1112]
MTHGVLLKEQLLCDLDPVTPNAAMAEPVNGPVFGARGMKMGMLPFGFKTSRAIVKILS